MYMGDRKTGKITFYAEEDMVDQDAVYWIWLADRCGPASKYFGSLIERFGDPFEIYRLDDFEILQMNLPSGITQRLCDKSLTSSSKTLDICQSEGIDVITYGDERYPESLKQLVDPPAVLYCRGHFPSFGHMLSIGVVGTRNMSEYGRQNAYKSGYDLARAGACVVSGMALGIDGAAACGALAAGGFTVAVLGCGVDEIYPKHHTTLMGEILRHGAVISEYPPRTKPNGYNFPKRNRIISGLSQGLLVVEASLKSGALITAKNAHDQGRDVFAIPGKLTEEGAGGPNSLIKEGAYPAHTVADIIKRYEFIYGDLVDKKKLEYDISELPSIDEVFNRYGMYYAVSGKEAPNTGMYTVKGSRGSEEDAARRAQGGRFDRFEAKKSAEQNKTPISETRERAETRQSEVKVEKAPEPAIELDEKTRSVLEAMPLDRPVRPEAIKVNGMGVAEVITAITMLEIYGLIESLPGGVYIKK